MLMYVKMHTMMIELMKFFWKMVAMEDLRNLNCTAYDSFVMFGSKFLLRICVKRIFCPGSFLTGALAMKVSLLKSETRPSH